ncbi:diguanylate cyclase/phosphodiesterase (GGDEF & EAL domains) with PAS/PAC sensor(s) [hydrothermal vent metagenome]|uniref:Diguanylate cyclase/phosphodiesterase (GGDEF & EAL domains) with PAS/PAC sensor(S) n=1 Tax=hydrothermal vent metagenome TaxID=652676 RepID=A0A1W1B9W7_9ZZZZ
MGGMVKSYSTYYLTQDKFNDFVDSNNIIDNDKLLIQIFSGITHIDKLQEVVDAIHDTFPNATLIGSTTDGEISSGKVSTGKVVISLTQFDVTRLKSTVVIDCGDSYEAGRRLGEELVESGVKLIISFTDGLNCNGEKYIKGLSSVDNSIILAGGMAGDNAAFSSTYVISNGRVFSNSAVGVALINEDLMIHSDNSFNWQSIGKEMKITSVDGNRVYTIDDFTAYEVYERYLGSDVAKNLPAIGVEFPLIIKNKNREVARAVLVKHSDGSLSFAGDLSIGDIVTFGYGDADMIVNHSSEIQNSMLSKPVEAIFVYSCMARRRFMPDYIENEIKPLQYIAQTAGFFTYGEFFSFTNDSELLNQTMTLVAISESDEVVGNRELTILNDNILSDYQKSIRAFSHFLNVTTKELYVDNEILKNKARENKIAQESLHRAQEIANLGSWEVDLITKKAIWSEEVYNIYKIEPGTIEPSFELYLSMVIDEDKKLVLDTMELLKDGNIRSIEIRVKRSDGVIINVAVNGKMLFDNGKAIKLIGTTQDITEKVKLRERNRDLANIIEFSSSEIYIVDTKTYKYLYANNESTKRVGYSYDEMMSMTLLDINKDLTLNDINSIRDNLIEGDTITRRAMHTRKDGTRYPVQSYMQYTKYNGMDVIAIFDNDITQIIAMEKKEKQQSQILEQIHDSVVSTDLNDNIIHWNNGATFIHGYTADEMMGRSIEILYLKEDLEKVRWMKEQVLLRGSLHDNIRKVTKNGDIIYTNVSLSLLKDEYGNTIGITRYSQDITQKKAIESKLEANTKLLKYQAYYDSLTQLPNRRLFDDRLGEAIVNANRLGQEFGLLFIDLDNFKQINDTLGHHYGDDVLKIISERLSDCLGTDNALYRLGGDEFAVIVHEAETSESIPQTAQKIIDALKPMVFIGKHELYISASIGISLYPKDSVVKNDLLKYADTAMYKAKDEGGSNYQFYSANMTQLALERAKMEKNLYGAIIRDEFVVHYQPQIDLRDGRIIGMEALVRWNHPEMGFVFPDKFIPLAEESGFIKELDSFVMFQAMTDVREWYRAGLNPGVLSLNLSIKQLSSPDFIDLLKDTIKKTDFDVKWLELEVTESQMMSDPTKSISILQAISDMGIEIAIDDFGTGYSSLAYLKRLPVDKLKIDQSFVRELPHNDEDRAISEAVIALAGSLNLTIIAEGVEKQEQIDYLRDSGCHYIQGYYYSKAINRDAMTDYIMENKKLLI